MTPARTTTQSPGGNSPPQLLTERCRSACPRLSEAIGRLVGCGQFLDECVWRPSVASAPASAGCPTGTARPLQARVYGVSVRMGGCFWIAFQDRRTRPLCEPSRCPKVPNLLGCGSDPLPRQRMPPIIPPALCSWRRLAMLSRLTKWAPPVPIPRRGLDRVGSRPGGLSAQKPAPPGSRGGSVRPD